MINRQLKKLLLLSFDSSTNERGQPYTRETERREFEGVVTTYQHTSKSDIRYEQCTNLLITKEKNINDAQKVQSGSDVYKVVFVNTDGRLTTVLLDKEV